MNLFGQFETSSQSQKKLRPIIATNESVEVIRSLAFELKYSEEITMFMLTLPVLFALITLLVTLIIDCKRRLLAESVLAKLGDTVMLTFCRAVT